MKALRLVSLAVASIAAMASPAFASGKYGEFDVVIEAVQSPAWIQRGSRLQPLEAGTVLSRGDTVRTGKGSRVVMKLGRDSRVSLGSDARLVFHELHSSSDRNGGLKGLFDVPRGAFSFEHKRSRHGRDRHIRIRFDTVSVDLTEEPVAFSGETGDHDIICLFKGKLDLRLTAQQHAEKPAEILDRPRSCHISTEKGSKKVPAISTQQEKQLFGLTELQERAGITQIGGKWTANLISMQPGDTALGQAIRVLESIGIPVQTQRVRVKGRDWVRVQVRHFPNRTEALAFTRLLKGQFYITSPWIAKD